MRPTSASECQDCHARVTANSPMHFFCPLHWSDFAKENRMEPGHGNLACPQRSARRDVILRSGLRDVDDFIASRVQKHTGHEETDAAA